MGKTEQTNQATPPKRKRGRPRKTVPDEKPKKKRGRPRKTPAAPVSPAKQEMPQQGEIEIDRVIILPEYYPRHHVSPDIVQKYQIALEQLPPININPNRLLIDGRHRIEAYIREQKDVIPYKVELIKDEDVYKEALIRNSRHGYQLTSGDKQVAARKLQQDGTPMEEILAILSVPDRTLRYWTQDLRDEEQQERKEQIQDLKNEGKTQTEISEETGIPQQTVSYVLNKPSDDFTKNGNIAKIGKVEHIDRSLTKPVPDLQVSMPAGVTEVPKQDQIKNLIIQGDNDLSIAELLETDELAVHNIRNLLNAQIRTLAEQGESWDEIEHRKDVPQHYLRTVLGEPVSEAPDEDAGRSVAEIIDSRLTRQEKPEGFEEARQQFNPIIAGIGEANQEFLMEHYSTTIKLLIDWSYEITKLIDAIEEIRKDQPAEDSQRDTTASTEG